MSNIFNLICALLMGKGGICYFTFFFSFGEKEKKIEVKEKEKKIQERFPPVSGIGRGTGGVYLHGGGRLNKKKVQSGRISYLEINIMSRMTSLCEGAGLGNFRRR